MNNSVSRGSALIWAAALFSALALSASAAITSVISNTAVTVFQVGGVTQSSSGTVALLESPLVTSYTDGHPTAGFGLMDAAYYYTPTMASVIIPPNGPTAIAAQGAPAPGDGDVSIRTDFSVDFWVSGGLASFTVPISYPIAYGATHAGMLDEFEAVINYSSLNDGPLGTSSLYFSFTGPGGSAYQVVSGADLIVPALTGTDILTLSGYFKLKADGFDGGSTQIQVFGAPEPSRFLFCFGAVLAFAFRRRRA